MYACIRRAGGTHDAMSYQHTYAVPDEQSGMGKLASRQIPHPQRTTNAIGIWHHSEVSVILCFQKKLKAKRFLVEKHEIKEEMVQETRKDEKAEEKPT